MNNIYAEDFVHKSMHHFMHNYTQLCIISCTIIHNYAAFLLNAVYNNYIYETNAHLQLNNLNNVIIF